MANQYEGDAGKQLTSPLAQPLRYRQERKEPARYPCMLRHIATGSRADRVTCYMEPMRIEVVGKDESSNSQARTYAEYRLFATLARYRQRVRGARIVLRRGKRNGACDTVVCAVIVALDPSGTVRARVREGHAYAAINRTVERIGYLMRDASYCP